VIQIKKVFLAIIFFFFLVILVGYFHLPEENITYDYNKLIFDVDTNQAFSITKNNLKTSFSGIAYVFLPSHENGLYKEKIYFRDGFRDGYTYIYHTNEKNHLKNKIYFSNGKKNGVYEEYDTSGNLINKSFYKNDKILK